MKKPTKEQQRYLVKLWDTTGPLLERIRREELRDLPYDWRDVDTLLELGDYYDGPPRTTSGLVEMQKWFMKLAKKQGLLPARVREQGAIYGAATETPGPLSIKGNADILKRPKIALLCSGKCPGQLIRDAHDLAQRLRDAGVTVISGFHSPMERECLGVLIRSPHPVVWCLARGMVKTVPRELRRALDEGRLLIVSSFPEKARRVTAQTAMMRNRRVADMACAVIVPHAAPGSKMEALCRELLAAGKPLYTFDHPANTALIHAGARIVAAETDWKDINLRTARTISTE
jgi:hypothetical protein